MKKTKETTAQQPNAGSKTSPILMELQSMPVPEGFHAASGPLRFPMTNDALFHIVFEANHEALKGFLSSLLRLDPEEISAIEVTNPIEFGKSVYAKSFVLDLRLLLNRRTLINLEMQVESLSFWKERSLGYLCRAFDSLNEADLYLSTKPAIHIGILNFSLFPDTPEFYSTYHLSNDVTHKKYSDKLRLSVLQLKHTDIATEEDRRWGLDLWAKFFLADSWEVIHALTAQNPYIASAAQTVYRFSEDERIRIMCEAREEGERTQRTIEFLHQMERERLRQEGEQLRQEGEQLRQEGEQLRQELQQKDAKLAAALAEIAKLKAEQR